MMKRMPHQIAAVMLALTLLASVASADDKSYSQIIKHIKSNYRAKEQGFFGMVMLARFAVKLIKPAGVKNFKVTMLRELDYSSGPRPESKDFHAFLRSKIEPAWVPLVTYSAPRERQWTYVYALQDKEDIKLLVVTVQKQDAVVLQTKFSPAKLVEFMNNPQIMGISLKDDHGQKPQTVDTPNAGSDNEASSSILAITPADMAWLCLVGLH
ncbi:MAG: hypothetical protein V7641_2587 [Blastocatellia bacterium]